MLSIVKVLCYPHDSTCLFSSHLSSVGRMNQREADDLPSGSLVQDRDKLVPRTITVRIHLVQTAERQLKLSSNTLSIAVAARISMLKLSRQFVCTYTYTQT